MSHLAVRRFDSISEIVFDDGQMNLLSPAALAEIESELLDLPSDTRLLLFRSGRQRLFAAGADMAAMKKFDGAAAMRFATLGQRVFATIERLDCLTLVLIDGDCYGGALDLALAFDLRWATSRSRFAHPGSRLGIVTGFGGTERLPRKVSPELARRLLLANEVITADAATQLGLVDRLFSRATEVDDAALAALADAYGVEAQIAKGLLRLNPALAPAQSDLLARRTEQLLRGLPFNGRT
jgi:enoyl-CoA hydratase